MLLPDFAFNAERHAQFSLGAVLSRLADSFDLCALMTRRVLAPYAKSTYELIHVQEFSY